MISEKRLETKRDIRNAHVLPKEGRGQEFTPGMPAQTALVAIGYSPHGADALVQRTSATRGAE